MTKKTEKKKASIEDFKDPADYVRHIRDQIFKKFDGDMKKYASYLKKKYDVVEPKDQAEKKSA